MLLAKEFGSRGRAGRCGLETGILRSPSGSWMDGLSALEQSAGLAGRLGFPQPPNWVPVGCSWA